MRCEAIAFVWLLFLSKGPVSWNRGGVLSADEVIGGGIGGAAAKGAYGAKKASAGPKASAYLGRAALAAL